jgi:hypothetical protein
VKAELEMEVEVKVGCENPGRGGRQCGAKVENRIVWPQVEDALRRVHEDRLGNLTAAE